MDMNQIIINNILNIMKQNSIKQIDLANSINVSKQIMSKILNGERMINAIELNSIANSLKVPIGDLVKKNEIKSQTPILAFMGEVNSNEAKKGIEAADTFSNLICFHLRCKQNGEKMMASWDE